MAQRFMTAFVVLVAAFLYSNGLMEVLMTNKTCNGENYVIDQATVTFVNHLEKQIILYARSQNCWKCSLTKKAHVLSHKNMSLNFSTHFGVDLFLFKKNHKSYCNISLELHDMDVYQVVLANGTCTVSSLCMHLPDPNIPAYCLVGIILALLLLWQLCLALWRRCCFTTLIAIKSKIEEKTRSFFSKNSEEESDGSSEGSTAALIQADLGAVESLPKIRIHSVDTLRGLSLVLMIFVNYGGGGYWYFHHAAWDGLTVADVVFPCFVFVMGVSVALSFQSQRKKKMKRLQVFAGVVRRSALLFGLGLMVSNRNVSVSDLRIFGVLQRLSLTYFVVGTVECFEPPMLGPSVNMWWSCLRDVIPFWKSWVLVLACVTIHSCLTFLLPVPGCPTGYLGPGGLHDDGKFKDCTGGAAGYIDRVVLGPNHIYQRPSCKDAYHTNVPFDPEGILGTLLSVVVCCLGVQTGRILLAYGSCRGKLVRWMSWSFALSVVGGALCGFRQFGGLIPLNKNLWSLSFSLTLSGMAIALFSIFYLIVDHFRVWTGAPFIYPGMNSIAVYLGSELLKPCFPLHLFTPATHSGLILIHTWDALFWIIASAVMYYNKVFVAL